MEMNMANESNMSEAIDVLGDGISFVRLINAMGGDVDVVNGARVSFGKRKESMDEKDEALIRFEITIVLIISTSVREVYVTLSSSDMRKTQN